MPYADRPPVTLDDLAGRNFATVPEVASILRCDPRTVTSAIKSGEIPAVKAGAAYRIPAGWLRAAASGETAGRVAS